MKVVVPVAVEDGYLLLHCLYRTKMIFDTRLVDHNEFANGCGGIGRHGAL